MKGRIAKNVLTDTGFWIALYDRGQEHHDEATSAMVDIEKFHILLPWPILYEVLKTRFIGNKILVEQFDRSLRTLSIELVDDAPYREKAKTETIKLSSMGKRRLSLVDMVIRSMLQNINLRIHMLMTYNIGDFADICRKRNIYIYPYI